MSETADRATSERSLVMAAKLLLEATAKEKNPTTRALADLAAAWVLFDMDSRTEARAIVAYYADGAR